MSQEPNTYSALGEVGAVSEKRSLWQRLMLDLRKAPMTARFGMIVILGYIILAVFAPILSPYGEAEVFPEPYAAWSAWRSMCACSLRADVTAFAPRVVPCAVSGQTRSRAC